MTRGAGKDFKESAGDWILETISRSPEEIHCHACNTGIRDYVVVRNKENGNRLILGTVCYDKLLQFLQTANVSSPLQSRKEHIRLLKQKTDREIGQTVMKWLEAENVAGHVPQHLSLAVVHMTNFGYAPSIELADAMVEFYKANRKVFVERFIIEARTFRHRKLLPNYTVLANIDRIRAIIKKCAEVDRSMNEKHMKALAERIRLHGQIVKLRELSGRFRQEALNDELSLLIEELTALTKIKTAYTFLRKVSGVIDEAKKWYNNNHFLIWSELVVYRAPNGLFYTEDLRLQVWREVRHLEVVGGESISKPGVYVGFANFDAGVLRVTAKPADDYGFPIARFDKPHKGIQGAFVGRLKHSLVMPVFPVQSVGLYVFLPVEVKPTVIRAFVF